MRPDHNEFQITGNHPICKQILGSLEFELVNKHAPEIAFFPSPMPGSSAILLIS
jgi:hypothetical protein